MNAVESEDKIHVGGDGQNAKLDHDPFNMIDDDKNEDKKLPGPKKQ